MSDCTPVNNSYEAIVDMGSNGIRFSITDVSQNIVRLLQTVHQERVGISLYDAQWKSGERKPIPDDVVGQVVQAFLRFKMTCEDFGVNETRIRVVATEATRVAENSEQFQAEIKKATGWSVELLSKQDEGKIGAYGIASSLREVRGLCMDLGGGSTQLSWIYTKDGEVHTTPSAVSMPYGAAALTQTPPPREEMIKNLKAAYKSLELHPELKKAHHQGNLNLYLSGGGFRGWGFALMDQHSVRPYPIPIINGFRVPASIFQNTKKILNVLQEASEKDEPLTMHRVSKRRVSQIPAVASLVSCVAEALPSIKDVHFCQGGVREGLIFSQLSNESRARIPLDDATTAIVGNSTNVPQNTQHQAKVVELLENATTQAKSVPSHPIFRNESFLSSLTRMMYFHAPLPKDIRAASALQCTITGPLAGTYGLDHHERAAFAIALCETHGGRKDLDPAALELYDRLIQVLPEDIRWWLMFLGRVAAVIGVLYPAGSIAKGNQNAGSRIHISDRGNGEKKVKLTVGILKAVDSEAVVDAIDKLEKIGKKKQWGPFVSGHKLTIKVVSFEE